MAQQYLMPKARNLVTGQTVMERSLAGRLELRQRAMADRQAQILAEKMSRRTSDPWLGFVEVYTADPA